MTNEDSQLLNSRAIEFAATGEFFEAIACFKRAIVIDSHNYLLWYNLGITYRDSGHLNKAREMLQHAYQISDWDEDLLETLAMVCLSLHDSDEALKYLTEGLQINCNNARCWNNLGVLFFNRSLYSDACDAFERAVCLAPYYYDALFNLRDTYYQLGNIIGADECERRLTELKDY
jgi:tetratricopeptide (TPR) repeat protein